MSLLPSMRHRDAYYTLVRTENPLERSQLVDAIRHDVDALAEMGGQESTVTQLRSYLQGNEETPFQWKQVIHAIAFIVFVHFGTRLEGCDGFIFERTRTQFETYLPPEMS